jgi:hypothetical protein
MQFVPAADFSSNARTVRRRVLHRVLYRGLYGDLYRTLVRTLARTLFCILKNFHFNATVGKMIICFYLHFLKARSQ